MKEGAIVSENDSTSSSTLPGGDIPASWGFHLLQELRRLEDRLESKIETTNSRIDALETKIDTKLDTTNSRIDALETKMNNKIDTLRREMDHKLDGLRYWSWASLVAILVAAGTLIALHL